MSAKKPFKMNQPGGPKPKRSFKNAGLFALLVLFGLVIYSAFSQPSSLEEVPFSQVIQEANEGAIERIEITGNELEITPEGEEEATQLSRKEPGSSIYEQGLT